MCCNDISPRFPPHWADKVSIEDAAIALDFHEKDGCYRREWDGLRFYLFDGPVGGTLLRDGFHMKRSAWPPLEHHLPSVIATVELMATIYRLWAEVFSGKESADAYLLWGKEWIDYQRQLKALTPRPPSLRADRGFFRYCLNHIDPDHEWKQTDYEITLSSIPGQLRIKTKHVDVYCPAHGTWLGEATVSARDLFKRLPGRFSSSSVLIECDAGRLRVGSAEVPATWQEPEQSETGARFITRFKDLACRNDAQLPASPRVSERGLVANGFCASASADPTRLSVIRTQSDALLVSE